VHEREDPRARLAALRHEAGGGAPDGEESPPALRPRRAPGRAARGERSPYAVRP
jgi:hypothetical protein